MCFAGLLRAAVLRLLSDQDMIFENNDLSQNDCDTSLRASEELPRMKRTTPRYCKVSSSADPE